MRSNKNNNKKTETEKQNTKIKKQKLKKRKTEREFLTNEVFYEVFFIVVNSVMSSSHIFIKCY